MFLINYQDIFWEWLIKCKNGLKIKRISKNKSSELQNLSKKLLNMRKNTPLGPKWFGMLVTARYKRSNDHDDHWMVSIAPAECKTGHTITHLKYWQSEPQITYILTLSILITP